MLCPTGSAHHGVRYPPFVSVIEGQREHGAPGEQSHAQQDTAVRRLAVAKRAFHVKCKMEIKTEALKDPFQNHDGFRGTLGILRYDEEVFQGFGEKCGLVRRFSFLHNERVSERGEYTMIKTAGGSHAHPRAWDGEKEFSDGCRQLGCNFPARQRSAREAASSSAWNL